MKKYEAVLILNPNLSSKVEDFKEEFKKLLTDNSFKITKLEDVGRRQLAYSINNHNKGHYLLMNLEGEPSKLLEIETKIKYNESIIRHLVLAVKNHSEDESVLMAESKNKKSEASESKKEAVQKDADVKEKNDE
jgi:small subunit ribosomal protein S6